jgi:hypothetical protein
MMDRFEFDWKLAGAKLTFIQFETFESPHRLNWCAVHRMGGGMAMDNRLSDRFDLNWHVSSADCCLLHYLCNLTGQCPSIVQLVLVIIIECLLTSAFPMNYSA